jgi:hypothetical protein
MLEYERRDAQTTLVMQQAARAVAAENAALREMLATRNVTRETVDAYLATSNGESLKIQLPMPSVGWLPGRFSRSKQ